MSGLMDLQEHHTGTGCSIKPVPASTEYHPVGCTTAIPCGQAVV
jgi:hypothetical protein